MVGTLRPVRPGQGFWAATGDSDRDARRAIFNSPEIRLNSRSAAANHPVFR
jgi:hypothetical protein